MKLKKISDYKGINIFIDSNSYENYSIFERIEGYYGEDEVVNIYELYKDRKSKILPKYTIDDYNNIHGGIKFEYVNNKAKTWSSHALPGNDYLNVTTECIFGKLDDYKFKLTERLCIAEHFTNEDFLTLFITKESSIIKKKDEIYKRVKNLNIVDLNITEEVLGLFFKSRGKYILFKKNNFTLNVNEGLYYSYSYRYYNSYFLIDQSNLNLTNEILFKGESIIKTLDELGFLFYGGTNNDASFDTKYYFYYYLVLICGIYDKLSIYINRVYKLSLNETTFSLNSKGNGYNNFIEQLRDKEILLKILNDNKENIDIVYKMRNLVVHTEGFNSININGDIIALRIDNDIKSYLSSIDNSIHKIKSTYKNGIVRNLKIENNSFLIPFIFSKFYFKIFYKLLNSIFKELGNEKFIDTLDNKSDFYKNLKVFEEFSLKLDLN